MSKSFMHDLYFGNLVPWERKRTNHPDYTPINRRIIDIKNHFKDILPPDEYNQIEVIEDLKEQSRTIEDIDLFGYKDSQLTD